MAEKQYLICDCVGYGNDVEVLTESNDSGEKHLIIRGKFQEAERQNKNKRVYPHSVLMPQVEALQNAIKENKLVGELDHPSDSIIHFENASHIITKLWWEDKCLMGEARILNTPAGKILESLIAEGIKVGISSRGVGSGQMNREGITVINDGFKLITFDIVADPSTPGAYLESTSNETYTPAPTPTKTTTPTGTPENQVKKESTDVNSTTLDPKIVQGFLSALFKSQREGA